MSMRLARLLPLALLLAFAGCFGPAAPPPEPAEEAAEMRAAPDGYLFCFWNVENLFDDHNDKRPKADEPYDTWFSEDRAALEHKLDNLCKALLAMNQGRGPDILAVIEVESVRAAELLQAALNKRLKDTALHYKHVLMKNLHAGRHIAPAIITRLPVKADRTKLVGKRQRILEGHVVVHGHELVVLASHWTSRLTDEDGTSRGRYGAQLYDTFQALHKKNRNADVLICGDFNDPPEAPSVTEHLRATGDAALVRKSSAEPRLLNLMAGKDPAQFGTHYYRGWWVFDQIVVAPGLLDKAGWSCDPKSVKVENSLVRDKDKQKRPWRFGDANDKGPRGYSDHFPVTVRLRVH